uniref:Plexin-A2-like isoform X2 n=1 Tax=Crassostrea virginica TaxID=6565 RepID=A0A8B8B150_CRAVI|nr:plexin-A2-like isoform X2 [Crassostrea virginica]
MNWFDRLSIYLAIFLQAKFPFCCYQKECSIQSVLDIPNFKSNFTHMTVHGADTVLLGGVNYIYRVFAGNLTLDKTEKLGPRYINSNPDIMYDSHVKVFLEIRKSNGETKELILCTIDYQFRCERRDITTLYVLSVTNFGLSGLLINNSALANSVAFIAPESDLYNSSVSIALYMGLSWSNTAPSIFRDILASFSRRSLNNFTLTYSGLLSKSAIIVDQQIRGSFPIQYMYGFASGLFSYVLTIQKSSVLSEDYITKLIRVCQSDKSFKSYSETPLRCEYEGKKMDFLQTAYTGKPGHLLAKSLGISPEDDLLFGIFGSKFQENRLTTRDEESALCVYTLRSIDLILKRNIQTCFQGIGNIGPDHVVPPLNCRTANIPIGDNYCGQYDVNHPINGPEPIQSQGILSFNRSASSIIAFPAQNGDTIIILGLQEGTIQKIRIRSILFVEEYGEIKLTIGIPILQLTLPAMAQNNVFVLTSKKMIKIAVEVCSCYDSCVDCLRDPFCGWNIQTHSCFVLENETDQNSTAQQCPSVSHINRTKDISSALQNINPSTDWTENITKNEIILTVVNFPKLRGKYTCVFKRYGTALKTDGERLYMERIHCAMPMGKDLQLYPFVKDSLGFELSVMLENTSILSTSVSIKPCEIRQTPCIDKNCIVHGYWSSFCPYGEWSNCTKTCGGGTQIRTRQRTCSDPPPSEEGKFCEGEATETESRECNLEKCPIYGTWTSFQPVQNWSVCSESCGWGNQSLRKMRTCILTTSTNKTNVCSGSTLKYEIRTCFDSRCIFDQVFPAESDKMPAVAFSLVIVVLVMIVITTQSFTFTIVES